MIILQNFEELADLYIRQEEISNKKYQYFNKKKIKTEISVAEEIFCLKHDNITEIINALLTYISNKEVMRDIKYANNRINISPGYFSVTLKDGALVQFTPITGNFIVNADTYTYTIVKGTHNNPFVLERWNLVVTELMEIVFGVIRDFALM